VVQFGSKQVNYPDGLKRDIVLFTKKATLAPAWGLDSGQYYHKENWFRPSSHSPLMCTNVLVTILIFANAGSESRATIPWGGTDFVQYYATARLLQQGQNPYDLELSSQIQMQLGRDQGLPTYGPPWCLLPAYLLGHLPFSEAVAINLGINGLLLLICTLCWTNLLFPEKKWLLPLAVAAIPIWLPTVLVLGMGQNSLWPLAGFTCWVWFTVRRPLFSQLLAGACLTLLVIKPHLGLLPGLFAGAFMLQHRQWRSILGFGLTLGVATLVTFWIRPSVWNEYLLALRTAPPPTQFYGATLDGWLRFNGGEGFRFLTWTVWVLGSLAGIVIGFRIPFSLPLNNGELEGVNPTQPPLRNARSEIVGCSAIVCTATLAVVPHAYSYDYVFMIPGFILALGSWIIWKERTMFLALIGWLLLVLFYSTGKSRVLQEHNLFIIPWSGLALTLMFSRPRRTPVKTKEST
jgi:hypothetical protein